jgi:hypothetical protein
MDAMPSFDADLVRRWLRRVQDADDPVLPHWSVVPTDQEVAALHAGSARLAAALEDSTVLVDAALLDSDSGEAEARFTELPARMLHRYLDAFAAGVGSTRLAFAGTGVDDGDGAEDSGSSDGMHLGDGMRHREPDEPDVGSLALAAGLNAGAAALHGEIATAAQRPAENWRSEEPTAAESARLAGFAAAELVVDGAGVHEIAAAAAAAIINGWRTGPPAGAAELTEHRIRGLVGSLLVALEVETRDPEPPAEPAACGAGPGENLGRTFDAEITFTMGLAPPEVGALTRDLTELAADVTVWPSGQWPKFHVHSDRPGDVLSQVFAYGTPFDLLITSRH